MYFVTERCVNLLYIFVDFALRENVENGYLFFSANVLIYFIYISCEIFSQVNVYGKKSVLAWEMSVILAYEC